LITFLSNKILKKAFFQKIFHESQNALGFILDERTKKNVVPFSKISFNVELYTQNIVNS